MRGLPVYSQSGRSRSAVTQSPRLRVSASPRLLLLLVGIGVLSILGAYADAGGQGYSIRDDKVVVDRPEEWRSWSFPLDILEITEEGSVRPRLIRRDIEAVADIAEFGGGIRAAGSNPEDAAHILDGDPETFWEPDPEDPLETWWVEIDLGGLISATELTLQFSEEADPFLQFNVLVSDGREAFEGSQLTGYRLIARTTQLNREQRRFRYEPPPAEKATEEWTGAVIQYIRIEVTDSRLDRAEEVREEEYELLPPKDRGAILYFIEALPGEIAPVTREEYEGLPPEERGPIRYHRRERPQLSEVTVRAVGDNVALGILDRGGSMDYAGVGAATSAFDGTFMNKWEAAGYRPFSHRHGTLTVDFGAGFWNDEIRVIHSISGTQRGWMDGYLIMGSDGSRAPDGTLIWRRLSSATREHSLSGIGRFEDNFSLRKLRFLLFRNLNPWGKSVFINEIQIYGRGYVPEVRLTSDVVQLGGSRNLTYIEWEGEAPKGTRLEIRTRTGDELDEVKHFFDKQGKEITEQRYNGLPGFSRGKIVTEHVSGADWSGWSVPYMASGDEITSPSPRTYAMIDVQLLSDVPDRFPEVDKIVLTFEPPVARHVVGEISPDREVLPGRPTEFALFLSLTVLPSNPGLDQIRLLAPDGVDMELVELSLGKEDDFLARTEERFRTDEVLTVVGDGTDSLHIRLPRVLEAGSADLIRVQFRAVVFLNGTVFRASIGNSALPDAWQRVDPGEATFLTSSHGMKISVSGEEGIIRDLEIHPNPFTPNGDGTNDTVEIEFTVLKLNAPREATVSLYSLGGKKLREIRQCRSQPSGRYNVTWTGEDQEGRHVPPGLYLCRIAIDADSESEQAIVVHRTICVAY